MTKSITETAAERLHAVTVHLWTHPHLEESLSQVGVIGRAGIQLYSKGDQRVAVLLDWVDTFAVVERIEVHRYRSSVQLWAFGDIEVARMRTPITVTSVLEREQSDRFDVGAKLVTVETLRGFGGAR